MSSEPISSNTREAFRVQRTENLKDPVSMELMNQAVSLVPCGHTLNESTVRQCLEHGGLCPLDRTVIQRYVPNYTVRHLVETCDEPSGEEPPVAEAQTFFLQGKELCDKEEYEQGITALLRALQISPSYEKAQVYLEFCLDRTSVPQKQGSVQEYAFREGRIRVILKLLLDPQVWSDLDLRRVLRTLVGKLRGKTSLTDQEETAFERAGRLMTEDRRVNSFVATQIKQMLGRRNEASAISEPAPILRNSIEQAILDGKLIKAVSEGDISGVEALIKSGTNVNVKDKDNCCPLSVAVRNGNIAIVALLIQAHADVNQCNIPDCHICTIDKILEGDKNNLYGSPLSIAIKTGQLQMAKLLLDADAERCFTTRFILSCASSSLNGKLYTASNVIAVFDPLWIAVKNNDIIATRMLLQAGAKIESDIVEEACKNCNKEIIKLFFSIDPKTLCLCSVGLVIHAAKNKEVLELVQRAGTDINCRNTDGETALHHMADFNKIDCAFILLSLGADVNAEDKKGNTPLDMAIKDKKSHDGPYNKEIITLLKQHGARCNMVDECVML